MSVCGVKLHEKEVDNDLLMMVIMATMKLATKLTMKMMTGCCDVCVQEVLQQLLIWRLPNIQAICREPDKGWSASPSFCLCVC